VKPQEIIGAVVCDVKGQEGYGCRRCGVDPGRLELTSLNMELLDGRHVILAIEGICPPDMDTGEREQRIVSVGVVSPVEATA